MAPSDILGDRSVFCSKNENCGFGMKSDNVYILRGSSGYEF